MLKTSTSKFLLLFFLFVSAEYSFAQDFGGEDFEINYISPVEYTIGGITVTGATDLDNQVLINLSGLAVGDKIDIPGEKIASAIENLWKQGLFADVKIEATKVEGKNIFINIALEEKPRLNKFSFKGIKKTDADDIREKIKLIKGKVVTDNLVVSTKNKIQEFYIDKGYLNAKVDITVKPDSIRRNNVELLINVNKGKKIKINDIFISGNTHLTDGQIHRTMKETKRRRWFNVFNSSKFLEENFAGDKQKIIDKYNAKGFRDAKISFDTIYRFDAKTMNIEIVIDEGHRYYFRTITFLGNSKHSTKDLQDILSIKKGDVYNQDVLNSRLNMSQDSRDVSSLYMDDGYLFFQINPVEVLVENDSIDIEVRIYEGKQAVINRVTIVGNDKTNDRVILREVRTLPGQLFSRADIIRTQRELAQMKYFDPEKLGVNPTPNPADGTVDIEYVVVEKPSDQIELSGGWGAKRIVGTLGVSFYNFSTKNIFKKYAWRPLPSGDGQTFSIRAQTNGLYYQSYNLSFVEPWLGGKKPNSFSFSAFHSIQNLYGVTKKKDPVNYSAIKMTGASIGLGKRLKWPDDYFQIYQEVSFQHYLLENYRYNFIFTDGKANNLHYKVVLSRSSIDQPIYPRSGSQFSTSLQVTPPYSAFRINPVTGEKYTNEEYFKMEDQQKYRFIEYHKWKFTTQWYTELFKNLVLNTKVGFGYLGSYNKGIGSAPFERFYLGGSGLTGYNLFGGEYIALRGYADNSLSNKNGSILISKYCAELRYPISLNPSATVFLLGFAEAGNTWDTFKTYNPFSVKKSTGVGVRIFLPMFGLLGLDYGWNLDTTPTDKKLGKGHFHFTIGANIGDL